MGLRGHRRENLPSARDGVSLPPMAGGCHALEVGLPLPCCSVPAEDVQEAHTRCASVLEPHLAQALDPQAVQAALALYRKAKAASGGGHSLGGPHTPTSACSVKTPLFSLGWVPTPSSGNYPDRPRLAREWLSCSIQILGTVEVKQWQGRETPDLSLLITVS